MRINKFLALHTSLSRRAADKAISEGRVLVDDKKPVEGQQISDDNVVQLDGREIKTNTKLQTIILNKPTGYVCSRDGQGSKTIYDLLPPSLRHLNTVGRLDKDSSGLILLTNDGELAQQLAHPKYQKTKVYEVTLNKPLEPLHQQMISDIGVNLEDGLSMFSVEKSGGALKVTLREGRNRQIRRTFEALGYEVIKLHRTQFGSYNLGNTKEASINKL